MERCPEAWTARTLAGVSGPTTGFDTESTLAGGLIVAARSDGSLALDGPAVGAWLAGAGPWPTSGQSTGGLREGGQRAGALAGRLAASSTLAVHNGSHDLAEFEDGELTPAAVADSLILSWLEDENPPHGLKILSNRRLGRKLEDPITVEAPERGRPKAVLFYGVPIEDADQDHVGRYCHEDAEGTADLSDYYLGRLPSKLRRWYWEVEEPHLRSCVASSRRGLPIDTTNLPATLDHAESQLRLAQTELERLVGWSINAQSPDQLAAYLYDDVVSRKERHLDGHYSTGRERWRWSVVEYEGLGLIGDGTTRASVLAALQHPVADAVLVVREWAKLVGTYLGPMGEALDAEGRIHPHVNPVGTTTGRVSCSNPNLQTLPTRTDSGKLVKRLVAASPGHRLVIADYGQLEPRIARWLAGMPQVPDTHQDLADRVRITRQAAKILGLSILYGSGPDATAARLRCPVEAARSVIADYWAGMPELRVWKREVEAEVSDAGVLTLPSGRMRHLPDAVGRKGPKASGALRQAVNFMCQGAGADVMRVALASLWRDGAVPVLQVHDSIVLEVPTPDAQDAAEYLERRMLAAGGRAGIDAALTVDVKIVERWES